MISPSGKLVVTVPGGPMSAFDKHIGHRQHFTQANLERLLTEARLPPSAVHGAGFPFFNAYRLAVIQGSSTIIRDASRLPAHARLAMEAFRHLFRLNRDEGCRGWQLVSLSIVR